MSLYSSKLDNIIGNLQQNLQSTLPEDKNKTQNLNHLNSQSHELKQIKFRSNKYKNSSVIKQEKQKVTDQELVDNYLNNDTLNVYKRPWTKLENGFKKNRILLFIDKETINKNLNTNKENKLKGLLYNSIDNNLLNKKGDIEYNIELGVIENINILDYLGNGDYNINIKPIIKKKVLETKVDKQKNLINSLRKQTLSNSKKREEDKIKISDYINSI
jgi:hypothetical protein